MNTNSATITRLLHWSVLVGVLEQITYIYFKININSYINITFELGRVGFVSGDNSTANWSLIVGTYMAITVGP
jgi:hypothetical protein